MKKIFNGVLLGLLLFVFFMAGMGFDRLFPALKVKPVSYWASRNEPLRYQTEDGIPSVVIVDGNSWRIERVTILQRPENAAETSCEHHMIYYKPVDNKTILKDNILHEIFHAGACGHGGNQWWNSTNDPSDHPGIYHLADFMLQFSQTNPEFIEWLEKR